MKFRQFLLSWILVLAVCGSVTAGESISLASFVSNDGNVFENRIDVEQLSKMPSWNAEEASPPINTKQAIEIARDYFKKSKKQYADAPVSDVKLEQCITPKYVPNIWYYIITFVKYTEEMQFPEFPQVLVMMDGTVNEPILSKKINLK
jgi:hypothetical protein